jgi:predicted O-linked N-acetylglucosamine transferase (SPINDLY family)
MTSSQDSAGRKARLEAGLAHLRAGRIEPAWEAFQGILRRAPKDADALHYSGLVLLMRDRPAEAAEVMGRAAAIGENADFNANFGLALRAAGKPEQAKARFRRALAANPKHAVALYNLGLLLLDERDWAGAEVLFRPLAEKSPDSADIAHLRGRALAGAGRADEAAESYGAAIRLDARALDPRLDLAELELARGRPEAADAALAEAARRATNLNAPVLMAEIRARLGDEAGRAAWLDRARAVEPRAADVFCEAGLDMRAAGKADDAERMLRRCLALAPDHAIARWAAGRLLPPIYAGDDDIRAARGRFAANIAVLEADLDRAEGASVPGAFEGLADATNFHLAYQEQDDRELQIRFGRMAARIAAARFPALAAPRAAPEPEPDGRLRIGIFSAHLRQHTVSRLYAGWIEKLDRRRFRLFGYHAGEHVDRTSQLLAGQCDTFRYLGRDVLARKDKPYAERFAELCRWVADDRPHALLFPEIGMDPTVYAAAALRLAPVQAAGIGHPVTTGLPTVDYFLSGELIEPEGAEAHYSETLVRLPNISLRLFDATARLGAVRRARADFGFAPEEIVYLSVQSPMKYLPRHDRIFPAIAKAIPGARFAFVRSGRIAEDGMFLARLARAFAAEGLERDRFCRFFDPLPPGEFGDLNRAAGDVSLDTPGWSGGNTTAEAIAAGLPVVTLPGAFMRGRVSSGMLRMIGVEDTIARDVDDYIALAVRFGREPELRARVRAKIAANRAKLYGDEACVRGLEDFLVQAVADKAKADG